MLSGLARTGKLDPKAPVRAASERPAAASVEQRNLIFSRDGDTIFRSEESMAGPGLQLFYPSKQLHKGVVGFVDAFAVAAERG